MTNKDTLRSFSSRDTEQPSATAVPLIKTKKVAPRGATLRSVQRCLVRTPDRELVHDRHRVLDGLDDLADVEGLAQEPVEALGAEALGLVVGELAAHRDDLRELKVLVALDGLAHLARVDVAQVHLEEDNVRAELLGGDAGREAALGDLDLVLGLVLEDLLEHLDDVLLVVNDHDARLPGHQPVEGHAVLLHEADELVERDAAVLAAGDAVAVQRAAVEPLADSSRRDVADLGDLAGREDVFDFGGCAHRCILSLPRVPSAAGDTGYIDPPGESFRPRAQFLPRAAGGLGGRALSVVKVGGIESLNH